MRALATFVAGSLVVALAVASAAAPTAPATGFVHVDHEARIDVRGGEPIACVDCHDIDARGRVRGRPGHDDCFGACHGPAPRAGENSVSDPDRREICETCHAPDRMRSVAYPPYVIAPDFALVISHASHAATEAGCKRCHDVLDARSQGRGVAHGRCASCHESEPGAPAMSACKSCHRDAIGPLRGPTLSRGPLPVTATFSHRRHLVRSRGACLPCHDATTATSGDAVPAPDKAACATCHDGERAFSVTEAACRRCHQTPMDSPAEREPVLRPATFSHQQHATADGDCSRCHELAGDGSPRATSNHGSCDDAGCHRADFARRGAKVCRVCHIGDEPWRPLHIDRRPPARTEFGAVFSHAAHDMGEGDAACRQCHSERDAGGAPRLPRDHARCTGNGCHERENGARPALDACVDCHRQGLAAAHAAARSDARWSVRDRFRHRVHELDPRTGTALPCTTCHAGAATASSLGRTPPPTKASCLPCHDGAVAFKMTGHSCSRCHDAGRAQKGQRLQTK